MLKRIEFAFVAAIFFLFSFAVAVSISAVGDPLGAMQALAMAVAA